MSAVAVIPVINKLLGAALQRGVSILFQKVGRARKIEASLKGQVAANENVRAAMHDYEVVLGSHYGELTVAIDEFHRNLEKTGIVDAIAEAALLNRGSEQLRNLFVREHDKFFPRGEGAPDLLYDRMFKSFSVTLRELCKDKVLLEFLEASHKEIAARLDAIELSISAFEPHKAALTDDLSKQIYTKLTRGLQQSYKEIRIETIRGGARPVDIDKIYIPPKLSLRDNHVNEKKVERAVKAITCSSSLSAHAHGDLFVDDDVQDIGDSVRCVTYKELRSSFRRVVILGDPGGGKSTLCQKICYDLSRNAALASQYGERDSIPSGEQRIAIRIILRRYEQARVAEPQLDLLTYICRDIINQITSSVNEVRNYILPYLESGHALLAFDGLDEILETSKRREVADLVTGFCDRYPLCPVIVTSRLVGYDDARLPNSFEELVLERFDDEEVHEYLVKFMIVVGEKSKEDAVAEAKRFVSQTTRTASDLRRNPLLLGLMAYLFNSRGDVPGNRPEIYKDCATLMFDRWDGRRGILANIPNDFERAELFSDLAARIYDNVELSGGVGKDWLLKALRVFFEQLYMDKSRSISAANALVDFIVGRAWIMSEVGDGVFAFTHQTFLEYFFARHMDASFDKVDALLRQLRPKIVRSEWDVVCHLALQLKTHTVNRKQDEALTWLSDNIPKQKREKDRAAIISFSARALEYLSGSEGAVSRLVTTVYESAVSKLAEGEEAFLPVAECYRSARSRKDFVGKLIAELASRSIIGMDRVVARHVAALMDTSERGVRRRRGRLFFSLPYAVKAEARALCEAPLREQSVRDPLAAVLSFQWFGHFKADWLEKYGLGPFCQSFSSSRGIDGLSWAALCASSSYGSRFRPSDLSAAPFKMFVRAVARAPADQLVREINLEAISDLSPPPEVWLDILKEVRSEADMFAGMNVLWALANRAREVYGERYRGPNRRAALAARRMDEVRQAALALGDHSLNAKLALIEDLNPVPQIA